MTRRRGRREGSVSQRHNHPTCPPLINGTRPEHRCKGTWVAMLDLGVVGGKRRRKALYGRTRAEAAAKLQDAIEAHKTHSLAVGSVTVEAWLRYWLDVVCPERGLKVNTMKSHRSKVDTYLVPHLGRLRLDRLEPGHVRAMYAAMRDQGLSEATLRQTHAILHRALKVAERERKVARNVAAMIDPPGTVKGKRVGLTLEQAKHSRSASCAGGWRCSLGCDKVRRWPCAGRMWTLIVACSMSHAHWCESQMGAWRSTRRSRKLECARSRCRPRCSRGSRSRTSATSSTAGLMTVSCSPAATVGRATPKPTGRRGATHSTALPLHHGHRSPMWPFTPHGTPRPHCSRRPAYPIGLWRRSWGSRRCRSPMATSTPTSRRCDGRCWRWSDWSMEMFSRSARRTRAAVDRARRAAEPRSTPRAAPTARRPVKP